MGGRRVSGGIIPLAVGRHFGHQLRQAIVDLRGFGQFGQGPANSGASDTNKGGPKNLPDEIKDL
jgi:hypothetical protein